MQNFIITLLVAITGLVQAQTTPASKTVHKIITTDNAQVIELDLGGSTQIETTKGSRIVVETTVYLNGSAMRLDKVLDFLIKDGVVQAPEAVLDVASNKKTIKVARPSKVYLGTNSQYELSFTYKVLVPEGIATIVK